MEAALPEQKRQQKSRKEANCEVREQPCLRFLGSSRGGRAWKAAFCLEPRSCQHCTWAVVRQMSAQFKCFDFDGVSDFSWKLFGFVWKVPQKTALTSHSLLCVRRGMYTWVPAQDSSPVSETATLVRAVDPPVLILLQLSCSCLWFTEQQWSQNIFMLLPFWEWDKMASAFKTAPLPKSALP